MATSECKHLIFSSDGCEMVMHMNAIGELFVAENNDMAGSFWFTITKEDWEKMKAFVDEEFKAREK